MLALLSLDLLEFFLLNYRERVTLLLYIKRFAVGYAFCWMSYSRMSLLLGKLVECYV